MAEVTIPNWPPQWEPVGQNLTRIKIPGGWIYRTTLSTVTGTLVSVALVFVPNPREA